MIFEANAFRGDWYGFLTNQAGHAYLVGFPAAWVIAHIVGNPILILAIIVAVYMAVWEVIAQHGDDWKDSAEDTLHVALGSAVALTMWGYTDWGLWPYLLQGLLLSAGVITRKAARG